MFGFRKTIILFSFDSNFEESWRNSLFSSKFLHIGFLTDCLKVIQLLTLVIIKLSCS